MSSSPTNATIDISYVIFTEGEVTSYRERRQVEWSVGTSYVLVDGTDANKVYIIDVISKSLVNTISNVETIRLLSVNSHVRNVLQSIMQEYIQSMITANYVA